MASISSAGIGSGLDVNSLVTQLVAAERSGADTQLNKLSSKANAQISALGTFKGALSAFKDAMAALKSGGVTKTSAQSGDSTVFTASAVSGSAAGFYDVEVVSLARAAKLASTSYASSATSVGTGTITIASGATSFSVTLADGADSLADLRDAINNASGNTSVSASIVSDSNGAHLVLSGRNSGAANGISVTSASALDNSAFFSTSVTQAAADAHLKVDGTDAYSASNSVSDVIDGVTLTLLKPSSGSVSLNLAMDSKSASDAVQKFVNSYNALVTISTSLTKYDTSTKTGAALIGDASVRGVLQQLRGLLGGDAAGSGSAYANLAALGISTKTDGTLSVDSSKLSAAVASDATSVQKLFTADNGYATRVGTLLTTYLGSDGQIDARTASLQAQLKDVSRQRDQLDARMTKFEARYRAQFTALDTLISQMKTTQSFLTQQLASLTSSQNSSSN